MRKSGKAGLKRLFFAATCSFAGLAWAWRKEAAFRQEVLLIAVLAPAGVWPGESGAQRALLIGSLLLVLIAELVNSAIEAAVDRVSSDRHELAGAAKDMGSAAVFVALVNALVMWGLVLWG